LSSVYSSTTESRSDRKLKPLPPDSSRHQDSAIARDARLATCRPVYALDEAARRRARARQME
jgi:hypothetical protein